MNGRWTLALLSWLLDEHTSAVGCAAAKKACNKIWAERASRRDLATRRQPTHSDPSFLDELLSLADLAGCCCCSRHLALLGFPHPWQQEIGMPCRSPPRMRPFSSFSARPTGQHSPQRFPGALSFCPECGSAPSDGLLQCPSPASHEQPRRATRIKKKSHPAPPVASQASAHILLALIYLKWLRPHQLKTLSSRLDDPVDGVLRINWPSSPHRQTQRSQRLVQLTAPSHARCD